ncbi:MAG: hypothetical protein RLZZ126_780 [Pseudomonadota bacterium]|jgi:ComF family protein
MPAALFRQAVRRLTEALPTQCAVCRAWQSDVLCLGCQSDCGASLGWPQTVDSSQTGMPCAAAVPYAFPWDGFVSELKFGSQPAWARHCATWMLRSDTVREALSQADVLVPMPLSRQRLRERGYNQALLLARELNQVWQQAHPARALPVIHGVLLRTRDTAPQIGLTRAQRLANLQGALQVDPLQAGLLAGLNLVVVDDVMTSGASLQAAAEALRAAGAASVSGVVFARAEYD